MMNLNLSLIDRNKGGKFLKKLWCCVSGSITRQFGFINWVDNVNSGHHKEIQKLGMFRALALIISRSESRNCGLCVVYIRKLQSYAIG